MQKKRIISLYLASLLLLSGCGDKNNVQEESKSNDVTITNVEVESKVFESSTHIIKYVEEKELIEEDDGWYAIHNHNGYDFGNPIVPLGYILFDVEPWARRNRTTRGYTYFFINEVDVEVEGVINSKTNTVEYPNPGKPLDNKLALK